jgi:hypothetical protein
MQPKKRRRRERLPSIRCGLTLAQKVYVQQQAAAAGLSDAEHLRRRALGYEVPARSERESKAALISEINRLGNQLSALGNLANQIARYCHTDRRVPKEWDGLPKEIKALLHSVEQFLEQLVLSDDTKNPS